LPDNVLGNKTKNAKMKEGESIFKKIKERVQTIIPLTLPVKLLVGTILGVIIGNKGFTYLTFIALFFYCIQEGARVPAEEIDIISPTTNVISIGFTSASGLVLLLITLLMVYLSKIKRLREFFSFDKIINKSALLNRLKLRRIVQVSFLIIITLTLCYLISGIIFFIPLDEGLRKYTPRFDYMLILFTVGLSIIAYILLLIPYFEKNSGMIAWFNLVLLSTLLVSCFSTLSQHETIKSYLFLDFSRLM